MKKHLFGITFLISAFLIIAHDAIPHHHLALEESELNVIHILKDAFDDHTKKEPDHNNGIPHHQHVLAPEDLVGRRNIDSIQKLIKIPSTNCICLVLPSGIIKSDITKKVVFNSTNILPDPYPFIISPNAMRGSPAV